MKFQTFLGRLGRKIVGSFSRLVERTNGDEAGSDEGGAGVIVLEVVEVPCYGGQRRWCSRSRAERYRRHGIFNKIGRANVNAGPDKSRACSLRHVLDSSAFHAAHSCSHCHRTHTVTVEANLEKSQFVDHETLDPLGALLSVLVLALALVYVTTIPAIIQ